MPLPTPPPLGSPLSDEAGGSTVRMGVPRPEDSLPSNATDRTGRLTIHPELLDSEGRLTQDDLLTVRFSADQDPPLSPSDAQP